MRRFLAERAPIAYVRDMLGDDRGTPGAVSAGLEELGRAVHPGPFASSAVGAVSLVAFAADELNAVGAAAIQTHGGLGYPWAHDVIVLASVRAPIGRVLTPKQAGFAGQDAAPRERRRASATAAHRVVAPPARSGAVATNTCQPAAMIRLRRALSRTSASRPTWCS